MPINPDALPKTNFITDLPPPIEEEMDDSIDEAEEESESDDDSEESSEKHEFYDNLAAGYLSDSELDQLAMDLTKKIDVDKESIKNRDKSYAEMVRNSGLTDDKASKGATFEGANTVSYPLVEEVVFEFSARAIKNLLPSDGIAKTQIIGPETTEAIQKADAKRTHINYQLSNEIVEFRPELEKTMVQLFFGGSGYVKLWYDDILRRPRVQFVSVDKVYVPQDCSNFQTAWRKTHQLNMTSSEIKGMMARGIYRDIELSPEKAPRPQMTDTESALKEVSKFNQNENANVDEIRSIFECYVNLDIKDKFSKNYEAPYIVVIDELSQQILAVYRNWDDGDITQKAATHMVEFPCIPWDGPYPIGFAQILNDIAKALTGSLRALLDAAHINNSATLIKLKGAKMSGQNMNISIGQIQEIDAAPTDDIRKLFMPLPFNPPSQMLVELMNFMNTSARSLVGSIGERMSDPNSEAPVGTTLALIEQGEKVFSSIHTRLHHAMGILLQAIHRLNSIYLDDDLVKKQLGDDIIRRSDYAGPCNIIPVSDPNIFSEAQRYAQMQAVQQLAAQAPDVYNPRAVQLRNLQTLKISDPESLLMPSDEPESVDPAQENVMASMLKPPSVFEDQDHMAHIMTHWGVYRDPVLAQVFFSNPQARAMIVSHVIEHMKFIYATAMNKVLSAASGAEDISELPQSSDQEIKFQAIQSQTMAAATPHVIALYNQMVAPFAKDVLAEWVKIQQEQQQQQLETLQKDPSMQMAEIAKSETQRKAAKDKADIQLRSQELQLEATREQHDQQMDQAKVSIDANRVQVDKEKNLVDVATSQQQVRKDLVINQQDNATATKIAETRIRQQGSAGHMKNGNTLTNPNPKG